MGEKERKGVEWKRKWVRGGEGEGKKRRWVRDGVQRGKERKMGKIAWGRRKERGGVEREVEVGVGRVKERKESG